MIYPLKKYVIAVVLITAIAFTAYFLWLRPKGQVNVPEATGTVNLPQPRTSGDLSVEEAIAQRRSRRDYTEESLTQKQVSQLMWAAQGITGPGGEKRTAPSAGATYPLEIYLVVGSEGVSGLNRGVYHYIPEKHTLQRQLSGDLQSELADAALDQSWVEEAPVDIVITAVYQRTTNRYGERGRRYVHLEAGHAAENLYLESESLNLGMVVVGAFDDSKVQNVLNLPKDHEPLYIIPVGHPT